MFVQTPKWGITHGLGCESCYVNVGEREGELSSSRARRAQQQRKGGARAGRAWMLRTESLGTSGRHFRRVAGYLHRSVRILPSDFSIVGFHAGASHG